MQQISTNIERQILTQLPPNMEQNLHQQILSQKYQQSLTNKYHRILSRNPLRKYWAPNINKFWANNTKKKLNPKYQLSLIKKYQQILSGIYQLLFLQTWRKINLVKIDSLLGRVNKWFQGRRWSTFILGMVVIWSLGFQTIKWCHYEPLTYLFSHDPSHHSHASSISIFGNIYYFGYICIIYIIYILIYYIISISVLHILFCLYIIFFFHSVGRSLICFISYTVIIRGQMYPIHFSSQIADRKAERRGLWWLTLSP